MRLLGSTQGRGHRPRGDRKVAWVFCALACLILAPSTLGARGTPAGTEIKAAAQVSYEDSNGRTITVISDTLLITVGQVAGVDLEPPRVSISDPGDTVVFAHTLENIGNGPDHFMLTASSSSGWPLRTYRDVNGDGLLDAGDTRILGAIALAADDTAHILIAVDVPGVASVRGMVENIDVQATSNFDGTVSDQVQDVAQIQDIGIAVTLSKAADRATATIGDVITFTLDYSASGPNTAMAFEAIDQIPLGSNYVPGTLTHNGASLTDAPGDDAGHFDGVANRVVFQPGDVNGGESGTLSFQVRAVGPSDIINQASASYGTIAGTDSIVSNSVAVTLVMPELLIEKDLNSPTVAFVGDEVSYTLRYGNSSSSVTAQSVTVSDTLPDGLEFVSSQPAATVNGQVLSWSLGDLAPGDTTEIQLTARVADTVRDTVRVTNLAVIDAQNALSAEVALAQEIALVGLRADQLSIDKRADVLEVSLGETAPYTLTVENTGSVAVSDIQIHDRIPKGGVFVPGSAIGADSVRVERRDVTFFIAGPLGPGSTHSVHYAIAIVSAQEQTLANTAYATAEGDRVRSEQVTAWIRVRTAWPLETRTAIGKVWIDLNDNGAQDSGEPGLRGADIWTDDGVVATSDDDGKFSFRDLRPGRHAFRLDPATIPAGYRLADGSDTGDFVTLIADGWTTPRVNFRLVPRGTRLTAVHLPISWRFTARPLCTTLEQALPSADGDRATIAHFETNSARLHDQQTLIRRVALALANRPECRVEVSGHADYRPVRGGPYFSNLNLSRARADSVARALRALGLNAEELSVQAFGATRPVQEGGDPYSLWRNRRVELRLVDPEAERHTGSRPLVQYELLIENHYDVPLTSLAVRFEPAADSVAMIVDDSIRVQLFGHPTPLPTIDPNSRLVVHGWTLSGVDSAVAVIERADRSAGRLAAAVHNYVMPVSGVDAIEANADTLPDPVKLAPGATVEIVLAPDSAGWPEATFPLPEGWEPVKGTVEVGGLPAPDPEVRLDVSGAPLLYWHFRGRRPDNISLQLRPLSNAPAVETVSLEPLRTPAERQDERRRAFVAGPAVEVFSPRDGAVLRSDRLFVGVRGEANAPVALFDGDSLIAEATMRVDGVHDFIAIPLSRGPHRLRVRMKNSWNQERWDSLTVHVTGLPDSLATESDKIQMVADGHTVVTVRARVLDRWGVPVINSTYVTVAAEGATPLGEDTDPSSVGLQHRTDPAGWLQVDLRPGLEIGTGRLELRAGDSSREIELELLPPTRPLMINGVGQLGLGSSPDDFGAITARGRIDNKTSVTLTYDTRRLDAGRNFFGRGFDPLEEARYPLLADASQNRTVSASDRAFAARIQRGFDYLTLGDVTTSDFSSGLSLNSYNRSITGASAQLTTGPIVWKGFGSSTTQALATLQIRGDGSSGPYVLQPDIRPGTEAIILETRAADNAQRVLSQQTMARYIDYQIDYENGTVLFKHPVPAADPHENPIFIVVSYEAETGGDREEVWGVRAAAGVGAGAVDSLRVGATYISDGQTAEGTRQLAGADVRLISYGAVDVGAEVSYAESRDSADIATSVDASLKLFGGIVNLWGGWMRVGDEYSNPANLALRPGTEEIRAGGGLRIGPSTLQVEHEQQNFKQQQVKRERTTAGIVQSVGRAVELDVRLAQDRFNTAGAVDESQAGEARLTVKPTPSFSLWTDARYQFQNSGDIVLPDYYGGGASYRFSQHLSLESQYRQVVFDEDSLNYSIASLGVVTNLGLGTQAWGKYQIAGGIEGSRNAAIVGLNNRLRLGTAWSFNTLFERRFGLSDAAIADPVRSLPFLQNEEDYWSAGVGVELLPQGAPYRMSVKGEYRDGDFRSSRLATLAGDMAINRSLAILARGEYLWTEQNTGGGAPPLESERKAALAGLAFRPTGSDGLNVLTKFEWLQEDNPLGGGVLGANGREQRLIAIAEAIWAPFTWSELAGRWAVRRTEHDRALETGDVQTLTSWADYIGTRLNLHVAPWLDLRSEGRLLIEHRTNSRRWDAAPSLVLIPINGFEVQGGYRFGDLWDPDFSVRGGQGPFVLFTARLTEQVFPTSADFWRHRF